MRVSRSAPAPEDFAGIELTYDHPGATADATMPSRYRHLERTIDLGHGPDVQQRATEALLTWRLHRGAGIRVRADHARAVPGALVVLRIGLGPLALIAPCRVIRVYEDADTGGFAYGTLPGHPETGEEAFIVRADGDGRVTFTVRTFSRPATRPARAGKPLTYLAQDLAVRHYLRTLRRIVREAEH